MTASDSTSNEIWRDIPGYEGVYQVSDLGRVKRVNGSKRRDYTNMILKFTTDDDGYRKVELRHQNVRRKFGIHQLVASAFIGICPPEQEVNHKDLNKANNTPGNLEYMTHLENIRHARASLSFGVRGSDHGMAKLNEIKVASIKIMLREGYRQEDIAALFKVSSQAISSIAVERTWRHVK